VSTFFSPHFQSIEHFDSGKLRLLPFPDYSTEALERDKFAG